ncbi:shikimate kinase [Coriobacterium glomerans PW2]|uniref:Shikimate kinase n=1 Tax=Coriobacterium glomerans (strain ATCC 49209 / DSM 20642 / JCM 10262 / PW2) TaxID=700015 RepID=F2N7Z7_CORGP|nr:shikimate kinase [Coriobacterium glomerans]AEB07106.1 shikimate kinase [Coriobacterium glomerans PW2]
MPQFPKRGCDHIFFIGFLGSGKSTLARNLGRMFGRRFVDTDRLAEKRAGRSVAKIFQTKGERAFRILETDVLRSLERERSLLVSCGGGIVETPKNIELMHEMGYCVFLDGDFKDSLRQIKSRRSRPDFRSCSHAAHLFEHRRPLYEAAADLSVDIRGRTFQQVSFECANQLLECGLI